jgi:hypothetical protein
MYGQDMADTQAMMQARDNPLNETGLCLLSLGTNPRNSKFSPLLTWSSDGGGVRGLSTLLILQALMVTVNEERAKDGHPIVKPCELFDLIGGTSTGG